MEIEGVSFNQACKALETKYDLPVWVYSRESVEDHFKDEPTVDDLSILVSRTEKLLMFKTKDIELDTSLRLWEAFNMLSAIDSKESHWLKLYKRIYNA